MTDLGLDNARNILGYAGNDLEELEEAYLQQCFEIKQRELNVTVIPRLFYARIRKLSLIQSAYTLLHESIGLRDGTRLQDVVFQPDSLIEKVEEAFEVLSLSNSSTILDFLRQYEQSLMAGKLELSRSVDAIRIAQALKRMIHVQEAYHVLFKLFFSASGQLLGYANKEIKSADQLDSGKLIQSLSETTLGNLQVSQLDQILDTIKQMLKSERHKTLMETIATEGLRIQRLMEMKVN